jgi:hypothetical protein
MAKDGRYSLAGGTEYELQLYHYHPKDTPTGVSLELRSSQASFRPTTSPLVNLDSRYDLKRFRFRFESSAKSEPVVVSVHRLVAAPSTTTVEFDLLGDVAGRWGRMVTQGVGLGLLLASPHVISALNSTTLQNRDSVIGWSVFIGVVTGIYAMFALRKSI